MTVKKSTKKNPELSYSKENNNLLQNPQELKQTPGAPKTPHLSTPLSQLAIFWSLLLSSGWT
jgi:hypothetical protein